MCRDQACLGYLLTAVIFGFAVLIYVSLKFRNRFLAENLLLSADQAWQNVAARASAMNLKKSDMLFGIWQDASATTRALVVKNGENEVVGRVELPMGSREYKVLVADQIYTAQFPITWNRTARLNVDGHDSALATYEKLSAFGKHKFEIRGSGAIVSERPNFNLRNAFNYRVNGELVGTSENISSRRLVGRLVVLPPSFPNHIKIFILIL